MKLKFHDSSLLIFSRTDELMTIVEYCPHGNLRNFLIKHRSNFIDQIVDDTFVLEINDIYERQVEKYESFELSTVNRRKLILRIIT